MEILILARPVQWNLDEVNSGESFVLILHFIEFQDVAADYRTDFEAAGGIDCIL